MKYLRPNAQRAKNAITLIWILMVLDIISLISGYFQHDLLHTAANGGEISMETANANDIRERVIGIVYAVIYIITAVTFIQWFRRAYFNLHQKVSHLRHNEGWAAGSWFVPIINLYRPYQIMRELYEETEEFLTEKRISFNPNFNTNYLGWWWTLWIISGIAGHVVLKLSLRAESIDELIIATDSSMISNIISIPLALIAVKVIKDYSNVEPLLNEIKDEEESTDAQQHLPESGGSLV
ncbi:MAG: DUF4328 domain-containing protein [Bacteroidota bacterium]|nr:DUF4328 domain-containing protein [Bacteroidota bacterium]